jgi:predicted ATPase
MLCLACPELLERHPDWAQQESHRLGPLPRTHADTLLRALAHPPAPKLRQRLVARAGGNPLFLEELSAFVAQSGSERELPPRLQVLLQARIDLLTEPERRLLCCAALEGTRFHRGALEALLPEDQEIGTRLVSLGRTLLIRPCPTELEGEQGFRFRHQLIRDTAYAALPKAERARLHEVLADWLARHSGERAELDDIVAYHLEQAALARRELDTPDPALERRAAEALAAGAEHARRRVDLRAAADLWRRALALIPDGDLRVPELELELGLVLTPLGEPEESRRRLEHAELRADDPCVAAAVRLALLLERLHFEPEETPRAVRRECERAIPLFERRGDHRALARASYTLAVAETTELRMQAAAEAYTRAAEHARLAGDRPLEALALAERVGFLAATRIPYSLAVRELEQLVSRFPGEPPLEAGLLLFQAVDTYQRGRREEARARGLKAIDLAQRSGYTLFAGVWLAALAFAELNGGDIEEAERLALAATRELERHDERSHLSWVKTVLAEIRLAQSRLDEALELADEAERVGGPHDRGTLVAANVARARAYLALGRADQARAAAARAVSVAESKDSLMDQAHARFALAQVLAEADEHRAALAAAGKADRLYAELDRALLRRRVTALIQQIERATAGAPA